MTSMDPIKPIDSSSSPHFELPTLKEEDLKQCKSILEVMKNAFSKGNKVDASDKKLKGLKENIEQIHSEDIKKRFNKILNYLEDRDPNSPFGSDQFDPGISLGLDVLTGIFEIVESDAKELPAVQEYEKLKSQRNKILENADRLKSLSCYYEFIFDNAYRKTFGPLPVGSYFFNELGGDAAMMFYKKEDGDTSLYSIEPNENGYDIFSRSGEGKEHVATCRDLSTETLKKALNLNNLRPLRELTFKYEEGLKEEFNCREGITHGEAKELARANPNNRVFYTTPAKGILHVAKFVPERDAVFSYDISSTMPRDYLARMIINRDGKIILKSPQDLDDEPWLAQPPLLKTPEAPPPPFPKTSR